MASKAALAIPIALGAASVSLYAFFAYNWRNKKKDDEIPNKDWTEHRMVLNKTYANVVLGQLQFIRQTTSTLINVLKITDEDQTFSIVMKGTPDSVQEAESMVNRLIEASPEITTSVLEVPKEKIKLFVGDFGDSLLSISQETGSKLLLKCDPDFYEVSPFYIEIQGPREKNALAYNLIRQTLGKDTSSVSSSSNRWDDFPKESPLEIINASKDSNYVEVALSAIVSINQFWVQLYRLSSALDKMERRLADYFSHYDGPSSRVVKPKMGAMIAVPYPKQGKWNRAMIVGMDRKSMLTSTVTAKFVDYGDTQTVKLEEIRTLPAEFSVYPHFAVECSLHGVLPKVASHEGNGEWSDEAIDLFESLTSDKPNKIIMARKLDDYQIFSRSSKSKSGRKLKYIVPYVHLVDTDSSEDVDIAVELVSKGYARSSLGTVQDKPKCSEEQSKPIIMPELDDEKSDELDMSLKG